MKIVEQNEELYEDFIKKTNWLTEHIILHPDYQWVVNQCDENDDYLEVQHIETYWIPIRFNREQVNSICKSNNYDERKDND